MRCILDIERFSEDANLLFTFSFSRSSSYMENLSFIVDSQRVQFNRAKGTLLTAYDYQTTRVENDASGKLRVKPVTETLTFKTDCKVPRVGCMLVGWGGNNGCTVTAAVLANKLNLEWRTRDGVKVRRTRPSTRLNIAHES